MLSFDFPPMTPEGTIAFRWTLPPPWPPINPGGIYERQYHGGAVSIWSTTSGKIVGQITEGERVRAAVSCTIHPITQPITIFVAVSWNADIVRIYLNGELAGSLPKEPGAPLEMFLETVSASNPEMEFSKENKQAQDKRSSTLGGTHPKHGRKRASDDYIFSGLQNECLQIRDLIQQIRGGGHHHISGLAGHLRTLIADRNNPTGGLLQWCAAILNESLILYTDPGIKNTLRQTKGNNLVDLPDHPLSRGMEVATIGVCSPTQVGVHQAPIDLDVWLNTGGAAISGKFYTNEQVLHLIGSTISAHFDVDQHPMVAAMQSFMSGDGSGKGIDGLGSHICRIADVTAMLCERVLTKFAATRDT
jgi:hypothetical protein